MQCHNVRIHPPDYPGHTLVFTLSALPHSTNFAATVLEAAGARDQPAYAGAPSADIGLISALGPASAETAADILFSNSATGAVLADDTLKLTGVTGVTLYSTSGSKAGVYTTGMINQITILMH